MGHSFRKAEAIVVKHIASEHIVYKHIAYKIVPTGEYPTSTVTIESGSGAQSPKEAFTFSRAGL